MERYYTITFMDILIAAMINAGYYSYRELSKIRRLSPGMRNQQAVVMAALPAGSKLRSKMHDCGEVDDWNNVRYCGVPLCPRCFMKERAKQTKLAITKTFAGVPNERLAFLTILLPVRSHLDSVRPDIDVEKRRLINLVNRLRRKDARWNDFQISGAWEVDRMSWSDYEKAGRNTRLALDDLEFPPAVLSVSADPTLWRPHLHAIVELGDLTREDVVAAIRGSEGHGGAYQVDLRGFDESREVNKNIQGLVRYSMKFRVEHGYKNGDVFAFASHEKPADLKRNWWPAEDIRAYAGWLKGDDMAGFRSLRFALRKPKANRPAPAAVVVKKKVLAVDTSHVEMPEDDWMYGWDEASSEDMAVAGTAGVPEMSGNNKSLLDTN